MARFQNHSMLPVLVLLLVGMGASVGYPFYRAYNFGLESVRGGEWLISSMLLLWTFYAALGHFSLVGSNQDQKRRDWDLKDHR